MRALIVSNLASVGLFGLRVIATDSNRYWFLFWNLLLAWVPVLLAWLLLKKLQKQSWTSITPILLTISWLAFLPNSFYLMSDLIHLHSAGDIGILFDAVLFLSCIWNGVVAGILSMVWVHKALLKRFSTSTAEIIMCAVMLLVSFAIYLGRSLRWNSWDLVANPAGLLFDVSERVINPLDHPQVFVTTFTFFILIGSMYLVIWNFLQTISTKREGILK